jgi:plastocyanin
MRFLGLALLASATVLGACGGDKTATGDSATTTPAATTPAVNPPARGAAAAPVTGQWHEVKMNFDGTNYKFEPKDITIKQGDGIRWTIVAGPPHNVAFDPAVVAAAMKGQLNANMGNPSPELSSPFMTNVGDKFEMSFAGVAPGKYDYFCTPHLAMAMTGSITVQ